MMYAANMGVHFPAGDDGCNMCTCAPSPAIGYEAMLICGTKTCPSCPVEKPATRCTHDPCLNTQCPLYPRATCSINNCGKCSASFEVDGRKVDCFKAPDPFLVASGFVDKEFKKCTMEPDGSSNCTEGICVVNSNDVPRQGICILPLQSQVCLGKDGTFYAAGLGVHFPAGDGCNFCTCEPPGGAGLPAMSEEILGGGGGREEKEEETADADSKGEEY
ncbi:hypothetical protein CBR_g32168 [Chara braunii]|uniref:Uncharacterized protein n=1 Tax=Chara braunii TaxID=69332 RepID=A0A388JN67_CHABU|nr:hypothetical protein CBR_g32168 [Chara braunii]|eukprot:GBG59152.1 hypothetical protein CBR_g32168 [Chara braunii]